MPVILCRMCRSKQFCYVTYTNLEDFVANSTPYDAAFYECESCGNNFIFPALEGADLSEAYAGYYTQSSKMINRAFYMGDQRFSKFKFYYDGYFEKRKLYKFLARVVGRLPLLGFMLRRAVRFVPMPETPGKKLVDIGCGNGQFLLRARDIGYDVSGIDLDEKTVEVAKSLGLEVKLGEVDVLYSSGPYDVVTLSHVIEHVHDPRAVLEKIYDLLPVGGYFYIATPNFNSAGRKTFGKFWRGLEFPRHLHIFKTDELKVLLSEVGYSKVEIVYDLPQSLGILRSSYSIYVQNNEAKLLDLLRIFVRLLYHNPFAINSLEVIAIRCWK